QVGCDLAERHLGERGPREESVGQQPGLAVVEQQARDPEEGDPEEAGGGRHVEAMVVLADVRTAELEAHARTLPTRVATGARLPVRAPGSCLVSTEVVATTADKQVCQM